MPTAPLPLGTVTAIALADATTVPVVTLTIVTFSSNKVAALAIMRVVNAALVQPILAPPLQQLLAWLVPSFWQMKALWLATDGRLFLLVLLLIAGAQYGADAVALPALRPALRRLGKVTIAASGMNR